MNECESRFYKSLNKIDFKMIRRSEKCWIKVVPIARTSKQSIIYIILNEKKYQWNIYDEKGIEAHEIFFEGFNIYPSFYLKYGKKSYRIDCKKDGIEFIQINYNHKKDTYIKEKCNFNSPQSSCWAKAIFYTSRPAKSPFDEM
ncbi:MAG: hypothetical protein AYK22_02495 [Thermoplasmatales archaeon SG8-52-3]|nr:MAG: hypothetical protein AYK22_02495 [Thermoplasmatales archaeon SG8-52-3]